MTEDPFNQSALEGQTFTVDWEKTTKVLRQFQGRDYEAKVITANLKGFANPIQVVMTSKGYDTLRLLKMSGIKTFSCVAGLPAKEGGRVPYTFAGAANF